jgi:hypothetical protein
LQWSFVIPSPWNAIIEKEERINERVYDPKFERTIEQGKIYFKNPWNDSYLILWIICVTKIVQQLSLLFKETECWSRSIQCFIHKHEKKFMSNHAIVSNLYLKLNLLRLKKIELEKNA